MIDTFAVLFRGTEVVREVTVTGSFVDVGADVDFGFGLALGFAVVVGFLVAAAPEGTGGASVAGVAVAPNELVPWPTSPSAPGGAVGIGAVELPPNDDPTAAARIMTAMRMPTHVRALQPEFVDGVATPTGEAGAGDADFELESEV